MALSYFGVKLSDSGNWVETPEGYVIFKNCVIARTGFQEYKVAELDTSELEAQGVHLEPHETVKLYRDEDEVFSEPTIASFNMKSITDGHPEKLLTVDSVLDFELGQCVNVRRAPETLDNGESGMLADLIVKHKGLIEKIKAGLRQLSCGYTYHILKVGNLLKQVDIRGNHVAVVIEGRAGPEASIGDSAASSKPSYDTKGFTMAKFRKLWQGLGFAAWAKDAKPEDVAAAFDEVMEEKKEKTAEGKDAAMHKEGCKDEACKGCKEGADAAAAPAIDRKRMHDALDKMLDGKEEEMNAQDADMEALKTLFTGGAKDGVEENKTKEETGATDDLEALTVEPSDRVESAGPGTSDGMDAVSMKAGAIAIIKALRPAIKDSKDTKVRAAFDAAIRIVNTAAPGAGTGGKGGYGAAASASTQRGRDAAMQSGTVTEVKRCADAEALYAAVRTKK